ncbi:unnamed protein product [Prorocentrum cordatum]|uniref:HNH nuclease domain-containing protein n=1 Tax=Prorocentrum cordatum TaxID=2364126 RepID=A0ABN9WYE5_9DINO|nr:unnamed protein product [Polarella glacialis]
MLLPCVRARLGYGLACLSACSFYPRHFSISSTGAAAVSCHGRIRSKNGIITWGCLSDSGYYFTKIGGSRNYVHRLVAHAFLGPPPSTQHCDVNHKDRDRGNNHIDNLEFVTRSENICHSYAANSIRRTSADALSQPVLSRWAGQGRWTDYSSLRLASLETGVDPSAICMCCKGRMISAKGYEFRYGAPIDPPCLPGEEWRPALHPCTARELSTWEVSSHGRLKSSRGVVSYGSQTLAGYRVAGITTDGRQTTHYVHRLVARAFLWQPFSSENLVVNHIDGNKGNNSKSNLEYVTRSQNSLVSKKWWLGRASAGVTKSKPVWGRLVGSESWEWYASMAEAARLLGLNGGNISRCCRGIARRAGRYEFKFADSTVPSVLPGEVWREIPQCLLTRKPRVPFATRCFTRADRATPCFFQTSQELPPDICCSSPRRRRRPLPRPGPSARQPCALIPSARAAARAPEWAPPKGGGGGHSGGMPQVGGPSHRGWGW